MMRHIVLLGWVAVLVPAFGQTYMVSTIGGRGKLPYAGDGQNAASVELFYPDRLAYDAAGNLYFAESYYNRVFRVAAADGKLTTAAGNGQTGFSGDHGLATAAALEGPEGIAVDSAGNLYIGVGARLCKVTVDGRIQVIAGTGDPSYSGDGKPAVSATFATPVAIALNSAGTVVYFSDETHDVVRKIDAAGIITTVAGTGSPGYSNDGQPGNTAKLNGPEGLAVDSNGNLYIADRFNNRIRKVRPDGTITTFAGTGVAGTSGDGVSPTLGNLFQPTDVVVDPNNDVFIADMSNSRVKLVDVQTGQMSNLTLQMVSVDDLAYNPGPAGGLAATDFLQHAIFSISAPAGSISQHPIAGTLHTTAIGDNGPASGAVFLDPYGVAVDGKGNVFVADFADQRVRRIATDLTITTVAGTGVFGNSNNGGAATAARIAQPMGIAVDASGNVYFTASCEVRVIQSNGNIASVAGNGGNCGYAGNNILSSSAQLYFPQGLAVDSKSQFLYISDTDNNRIRKVNLASSIITTLAGNGQQGYAGNGTDALSATMDTPVGIAVDSKGNVYFADQNNNRVRKIAADGNIYDVAGTGKPGNDGDGGPAVAATLAWPTGLAVDPSDNLYVTSSGCIRRISTDGSIATIAGTGWMDFSGDGDLATLADMDPWYVAVDGNGRIYFSDENNLRIRRLDPAQIYPSGVVNGATYQRGPVAPGEVIVIFGSGLGPAQIAQASLDAAGPPVPTSLGGAQIAFDGIRAPLLYVSAAQASAIVPFAVAGKSSTVMQVAYQNKTTNAITMAVSPASPGLFTVAQNGSGQGCILNQDYSLNSAANPAARGDIVMIWGTGGGPTVPASMDGQFTTGTYPTIPPPVTATIGGVDAEVIWAGAAPGMVAGINQFNIRVPSGAASGNNVPIILKVGSVASPASATLAVK